MAGYATPAWSNNSSPAIDATALTNIGEGIEIAEHPYGECSTSSSTASKVVTIDYSGTIALFVGLSIRVKFTYRNAVASPTLNVNGTGAISIVNYDSSTPQINSWQAGEIVDFTYDGTNWVLHGGSESDRILVVTAGPVSSFPITINDARISTTHVLLSYYFSDITAVGGPITATTAAGSLTVSGTYIGSRVISTASFILGKT